MSRICCVTNCSSKYPDKENHRTLFKFRETSKYYETWIIAIGIHLRVGRPNRKSLFICELHFQDSCLIKTPIKILKDGFEVTLPRKRVSLRPKSVPTIFSNNTENSKKVLVDRCANSATKSTANRRSSPPTTTEQQSPSLAGEIASSNTVARDSLPPTTTKQQPLTLVSFQSILQPSSMLIDQVPRSRTIIYAFLSQSSIKQRTPVLVEKYPHSSIFDFTNQSIGMSYSTVSLFKEWNSRPPQSDISNWGAVKTAVGVLFMLCDSEVVPSGEITSRTVLVKEDMTFEFSARGRAMRLPSLEKATCLQDVLLALRTVADLQICEGTSCKNVFYNRKSTARCNRCKACQVRHRREQDRERKRDKRAAVRATKEKKLKRNIKRKLARSEQRAARYKEDLQTLREECAAKKEEFIDVAMKDFDDEMLEAVRACWAHSKGGSSKDIMIDKLNRGFLKYPSDSLLNLLSALERAILRTVGEKQLNFYTFQRIVHNVVAEKITLVGCNDHKDMLTRSVINYYLVTRAKTLCKQHNKVYSEAKKKEQELRKKVKLVGKQRDLGTESAEPKKTRKQKGAAAEEAPASKRKR